MKSKTGACTAKFEQSRQIKRSLPGRQSIGSHSTYAYKLSWQLSCQTIRIDSKTIMDLVDHRDNLNLWLVVYTIKVIDNAHWGSEWR